MNKSSALADWTPEQLALGKRWVETWKLAAVDLERIKRKEIRELDTYKTILFFAELPITPNLPMLQNRGRG
jgi:hypothetical protein